MTTTKNGTLCTGHGPDCLLPTLGTLFKGLAGANDLRDLGEALDELIGRLMVVDTFVLYVREPGSAQPKAAYSRGISEALQSLLEATAHYRQPGEVLRTGKLRLENRRDSAKPGQEPSTPWSSRLYLPMAGGGRVLGVIALGSVVEDAFDERAIQILSFAADLAAVAFDRLTLGSARKADEARFKAVVEDQTELICRFDPKGRLTFVNGAYCRYFSRTAKELLGKSFLPLIPREDQVKIDAAMAAITPTNPTVTYEHRVIMPDGQLRWTQWTDHAIYDSQGLAREFQAVGRDITDLMAALEQAAESRRRLQNERDLAMALGASSDLDQALGWVLDAAVAVPPADSGGIYRVRPEDGALVLLAHRGLGEAFVQHSSFYPPDSPNAVKVKAGKAIYANHASLAAQLGDSGHLRRQEGLRALAIVPIVHQGQVLAVLNIASHSHNDFPPEARTTFTSLAAQLGSLLARFAAEDALRQSQQNLQTMFDSLEDFLFVLGPDASIQKANPVVYKRLGYDPGELLGVSVLEVHPPTRRQEALEIVTAMLEGTREFCPVPLWTKDGNPIPVETKVAPGLWNGQPAIFGISRDITERLKAQDALRRAKDELEDRVQERTAELLALNQTLLAEVKARKRAEKKLLEHQAWLQGLASELSVAEERERRRIAVEIHDRLGQVLALARIRLDLAQSLGDLGKARDLRASVVKLLDRAVDDAHSLAFELSPPVLYEMGLGPALEWLAENTFKGEETRVTVLRPEGIPQIREEQSILLFQVARELLANVAKHAKASSVELRLKVSPRVLTLEIQDDGRGFEGPWGRASREAKGGFGLPSINERVRGFGGRMEIKSRPDLGTLARVRLPRSSGGKR